MSADGSWQTADKQFLASDFKVSRFSSGNQKLETGNLLSTRHSRSKRRVAYLVRSLELVLELSSHDWHVQPYCQRPNRFPPEGRAFSPEQIHTSANLSVLETF